LWYTLLSQRRQSTNRRLGKNKKAKLISSASVPRAALDLGVLAGWSDRSESGEGANPTPHRTKVVVNKRTGHYLYLDGREEFNRFVLSDMENVNKRERGP
jgi:hypothetical protein